MISIALALASSVFAQGAGPEPFEGTRSRYDRMYVTQCVDGEMVSRDLDSTVLRRGSRNPDSIPGPGILSLGYDVELDGRRLVCVQRSRVLRLTDSTVVLQHHVSGLDRLVDRVKLPVFSLGASLSFDASATGSGVLQDLMGASVDTVGDASMAANCLPSLDASFFRIVGFRYSPGFGGAFYIPGQGRNSDDKVDLSYRETRWGPYLELPLRLFWKAGPPIALRASYQWISGRLELNTDTLRQELVAYSGHSDIHIDLAGDCRIYSFVYGDELFFEANFIQKVLRFEGRTIHQGINLGVGFGVRI